MRSSVLKHRILVLYVPLQCETKFRITEVKRERVSETSHTDYSFRFVSSKVNPHANFLAPPYMKVGLL